MDKKEKTIDTVKEIFPLLKRGLTPEQFAEAWKQYNSHYCDYTPAYSQKCGSNKDAHSIAHIAVIYDNVTYYLCDKHSTEKCFRCSRPATEECHFCGQFVCGVPHCPDHQHEH